MALIVQHKLLIIALKHQLLIQTAQAKTHCENVQIMMLEDHKRFSWLVNYSVLFTPLSEFSNQAMILQVCCINQLTTLIQQSRDACRQRHCFSFLLEGFTWDSIAVHCGICDVMTGGQ